MYQLVEAQDECDQKVLHILQGRNFWVAVQLFEDRTGSMQRVEGLLTLILEDISKNVIKDCRVETCLAVGLLAPAHSILIHFRDGMLSKPNRGDGNSYTLCQKRRGK